MKTVIIILIIALIGRSIAGKTLDLDDFGLNGDDLAEAAATSLKKNTEYTDVNFRGRKITYKGASAIAKILNTTVLTSLNLGHNEIGAEGVAVILNASKTSRIDYLNLDLTFNGPIENISFVGLLENSRMRTLNLVMNGMLDNHALDIAKVLNRTRIEFLNLGLSHFEAKGVTAILKACKNHPIVHLGLNLTAFGEWGDIDIAGLLENTRIRSMNLGRNDIHDETAGKIVEASKGTQVTFLDLNSNRISTGREISGALNYSTITKLNLERCRINEEGATNLAKVLANTCITDLNLRKNPIGDGGMEGLIQALPNTIITKLLVSVKNEVLDNTLSTRLRENQVRIDGLYEELKKLVVAKNGNLEFAHGSDRQRCANFTGIISGKGRGYIEHFSENKDGSFTRDQIEEFILNIEMILEKAFL